MMWGVRAVFFCQVVFFIPCFSEDYGWKSHWKEPTLGQYMLNRFIPKQELHSASRRSASFLSSANSMAEKLHDIAILMEAATDIGRRYFSVCMVVLHPYDNKQLPLTVFTIMKLLSAVSSHNVCVIALNFWSYPRYLQEQNQERCSRIMNIVYGEESLTKKPFAKLTKQVSMAGPLWLLLLQESTDIAEYLEDGNLPFDVDLVAAQLLSDDSVLLHEAYRASLAHPVRVLRYGNWTAADGLRSPPHVSLYYRRNNFEGVVFKVATTESYPIVSLNRTKNGSLDISGYFANVWKELESRLNFSSVYMTAGTSGIKKNSTWTGVMGMVLGPKAHVGVASLMISPERSTVVDFLRPLISTKNNFFYKKPGLEIRWNAIFRPFETGVWVTILVWVLVGSVLLRNIIYLGVKHRLEPKTSSEGYTVTNSFFCLLRVYSQQGTPKIPEALPGRIVLISSYMVAMVVLTAYSGALISFIAVETPRIPFNSLGALLKDPSYRLHVVRDTAAYMYFANATDPTLIALFEKMGEDLPMTLEEGLERVCTGYKLVQFGPQAAMDLIVQQLNLNKGCNIMGMPNALNTAYLSVIIEKKNQYRDALNHHLDMMIYQGLLGRLRKQLWPTLGPLVPERAIEVKTEQVVPIFMVLLAGICIALVIFVVEKMKNRRRMSDSVASNKIDVTLSV